MPLNFLLEQFLDTFYCLQAVIASANISNELRHQLEYYGSQLEGFSENLAESVTEAELDQYRSEAGLNFYRAWVILQTEDTSKARAKFAMAQAKMGMLK